MSHRLCSSTIAAVLVAGCLPPPPPLIDDGAGSEAGAGSTGESTSGSTSESTDPGTTGADETTTTGETSGDPGFIVLSGPCVDVTAGQTVAEFLQPGATIESCSFDGGLGDGRVPEGLTLGDAPDCAITGEITEQQIQETTVERIGTWAFIVRVVRAEDGATAWVPHCASRSFGENVYALSADYQGGPGPAVVAFTPGQPLSYGDEERPRFYVTNSSEECPAGGGGIPCNERNVNVSTSEHPLGDPVVTLVDNDDSSYHAWMQLEGTVPAMLDRPWALTVDLDFCLESGDGECAEASNVEFHGKGDLAFGMIFEPR